jgi:hypothetical protein
VTTTRPTRISTCNMISERDHPLPAETQTHNVVRPSWSGPPLPPLTRARASTRRSRLGQTQNLGGAAASGSLSVPARWLTPPPSAVGLRCRTLDEPWDRDGVLRVKHRQKLLGTSTDGRWLRSRFDASSPLESAISARPGAHSKARGNRRGCLIRTDIPYRFLA